MNRNRVLSRDNLVLQSHAQSQSHSYVEIYGENVTDLLNENATVGQWQGVAHRAVFVYSSFILAALDFLHWKCLSKLSGWAPGITS